MIKLICTLVTPVLLPSAHLIIIPLSPVHHTEPFKTFLFYPCDDNSSLCFVTYSHPLLIHHTTPFTSNPSSFPCIYTYMSKKKTVLNTERSWCKSYLSITTDLNLLMVIPRVYQMMSLLERNTCSKDQWKRNEFLFAFLIIATLAVLGRTCKFLAHPFRGSSVHSNGNIRGWYLTFYRHGISYLTDCAIETENM